MSLPLAALARAGGPSKWLSLAPVCCSSASAGLPRLRPHSPLLQQPLAPHLGPPKGLLSCTEGPPAGPSLLQQQQFPGSPGGPLREEPAGLSGCGPPRGPSPRPYSWLQPAVGTGGPPLGLTFAPGLLPICWGPPGGPPARAPHRIEQGPPAQGPPEGPGGAPLLFRWRPRKSYKQRSMGLPSTKSRRRWAAQRR